MSSIAGSWRQYPQRYRYEGNKNKKSGKIFFPPRLIDPDTKSREFEKVTLATEGEIETYTILQNPPSAFTDLAPIAIAIIKLTDGSKLNAQLADCDTTTLKIGDKVKLEFRKITEDGAAGIIYYGYKAVVV